MGRIRVEGKALTRRGGRRRGGRACGIGEEGWDAVLRGAAGRPAALSPALARLGARPAAARWRVHWPAVHEHPLAFSDCIRPSFICNAKKDGCLGGFRESRVGFQSTEKSHWVACMACAAAAAAAAADTAPGE